MRSNLAKYVAKTHRNNVAEIVALSLDLRDVMSIKGGSLQRESKAMKAEKIAKGIYLYRGVRIFKHQDGFSYHYSTITDQTRWGNRSYPVALKTAMKDVDEQLLRRNASVDMQRIVIDNRKVEAK